MANLDRPRGFEPYGGVKRTAKFTTSAAVYPGDALTLGTDGLVKPLANTGDAIFGISLEYASSSGKEILVSIDPEQLYIVQADETHVDVQADIGNTADTVITGGDSTYKISRMELDSDTLNATAVGNLQLLGILPNPKNAFGAQVDCIVKIKEHQVFGKDNDAGV